MQFEPERAAHAQDLEHPTARARVGTHEGCGKIRAQRVGPWRERPLACRIGIHTGYCTVGNFGSDDRMDYTIIGGAVNLASRLEHEAAASGILISYETFAHVKDQVRCEEMGPIQVRGIAHPVATWRVVDLHTNLIFSSQFVYHVPSILSYWFAFIPKFSSIPNDIPLSLARQVVRNSGW